MTKAALQIYRTFLRQARRMAKREIELEVRKPVTDSWGSHSYSEAGLAYQASAMAQLLGSGLRYFPGAETLNSEGLRRVLRSNFKSQKEASEAEAPRLVGEALSALRVLLDQLYMHRCSSSCTTDGVRIDATSKFSTAATAYTGRTQNLFTYRIRITNQRQEPIQVLGREWTIQNDKGTVVVQLPHVHGNAIVGQTPIIPPGHAFEYISGTDLDTAAGRQEGKLEIGVLEDSRTPSSIFMATVAPFQHMRPDVYRR